MDRTNSFFIRTWRYCSSAHSAFYSLCSYICSFQFSSRSRSFHLLSFRWFMCHWSFASNTGVRSFKSSSRRACSCITWSLFKTMRSFAMDVAVSLADCSCINGWEPGEKVRYAFLFSSNPSEKLKRSAPVVRSPSLSSVLLSNKFIVPLHLSKSLPSQISACSVIAQQKQVKIRIVAFFNGLIRNISTIQSVLYSR